MEHITPEIKSKKPVPKPRKLTHEKVESTAPGIPLGRENSEEIADEVFNVAGLEDFQNLENERKLKSFRNKSYNVALEDDSLDVQIPEPGITDDTYLPMGMGLLAAVSPQQKPIPKPRPKIPSKSQSVDELSSNIGKEAVVPILPKSPTIDVISNKLKAPQSNKEKPVSDSDIIHKEKCDGVEIRRRSTTWYDSAQVTPSNFPEQSSDIQSSTPHVIQPGDEVKLPTRKEKHSHYLSGLSIGSHILDTFKSWTSGGSSSSSASYKYGKDDKPLEEPKKDRNSKFYCEIDNENLPHDTEVENSVPPLPSPRTKDRSHDDEKAESLSTESQVNLPVLPAKPSNLSHKFNISSPVESSKNIDSDIPPLPPPRKRKTKSGASKSVQDAEDTGFKRESLDLMAEINEKLANIDVNFTHNEMKTIISDSDNRMEIKDSGKDKTEKLKLTTKSSSYLPNSSTVCASIGSATTTTTDKKSNMYSNSTTNEKFNDIPKNSNSFSNPCILETPEIDELDVIIPPSGVGHPKVPKTIIPKHDLPSLSVSSVDELDNTVLPVSDLDIGSAPVTPAPRLPNNHNNINRISIISTTGSELDMIVHEDNDDSDSDSEYYDGYVEPGYVSIDPSGPAMKSKSIRKKSSRKKGGDSSSALAVPAFSAPGPALPPRARSASPGYLSRLPPAPPTQNIANKTDNQSNVKGSVGGGCENVMNNDVVVVKSVQSENNNNETDSQTETNIGLLENNSTESKMIETVEDLNDEISLCAICDSPSPLDSPGNNKFNYELVNEAENDCIKLNSKIGDLHNIPLCSEHSLSVTYVSADSSDTALLDSFIPPESSSASKLSGEETLKPNVAVPYTMATASSSDLHSNSSSSDDEHLYEILNQNEEDSYSIFPIRHRNSDTSTSFSSNNSDNSSTPPRILLRKKDTLNRLRSSGSESSSRPASWASSCNSDYFHIPWISTEYRMNQSHSLDVLSLGSPSVSIMSVSSDDEEERSDEEEEKERALKQEEKKRKRKQFFVAQEIMTSERNFVDILKLLNEDFRNVIAKSSQAIKAPVVPPNVLSQILRHLPEMQKFNEALLHDLIQRIDNWENNPRIADIFVQKGPFLKLYTSYIMDFEHKGALFDDARKKYYEFDKCTTMFEGSARCHMLSLHTFLLKPVQRLPQYRLLLNDYQKYLTPDSPDYEDAQTALKIVTEVAEHANQSMIYGENLNKLLQIQNSLIGRYEVIKPGRYLIKEGELLKLSRKEMQPRHFFLLNDVLLYATPFTAPYSTSQYRLNNAIPLIGMKVDVPNKEGYQNEFSIISTQRSFTVCTATAEEKDDWLKVLREAIKENNDKRKSFVPNLPEKTVKAEDKKLQRSMKEKSKSIKSDFKLGSQHPLWIPDSRVSMCMLCTGEFTLAFRRHHCRSCGKVVCGFCSDYKAPLEYLNNKPSRVCKDCYGTLKRAVRGSLSSKDEEKVNKVKDQLGKFSKSSHGIRSKILKITESQMQRVSGIRESLGMGPWMKPESLKEVSATDPNAITSGYLKMWKDKKWNKRWFVLKGKVLYGFKGSEDTAATDSTVLLGYEVRPYLSDGGSIKIFQGVPPHQIFELIHKGLPSIMFATENPELNKKWMTLFRDASVP